MNKFDSLMKKSRLNILIYFRDIRWRCILSTNEYCCVNCTRLKFLSSKNPCLFIDNHRLQSLFHFWSWSNTSSSIKSFPSVSASTLFQHQIAITLHVTLCFVSFSSTFFSFFSALIWWSPFNWIPLCGKNY